MSTAHDSEPYYYVPQPSHWPITGSCALLLMAVGAASWFNAVRNRDRGWCWRGSRCSSR